MGLAGWENRVLEATATGEAADFSPEREAFLKGNGPEPVIVAKILRQFMLGLKTDTPICGVPLGHCVRWEIKGATVDDTLDLRGGRLPGGAALAPLRFVDCIFQKGFRADGAHLESLSFEECFFQTAAEGEKTIAPLCLRNARIESEFRISSLKILKGEIFWIDASSSRLGANFICRQVKLRAPALLESAGDSPGPYALDLLNARIGASLWLQPDVELRGGLRLLNGQVQGNVHAEGLFVTDGEDPKSRERLESGKVSSRVAIALQGAHVEGHLLLRRERFKIETQARRLVAEGALAMYGLQIGGTLDLTGLQITNEGSKEPALLLTLARISAVLLAQDLFTVGSIAAQGCAIGGDVYLGGSTGAINIQSCNIEGGFFLSGPAGAIDIQSCNIGGNFFLTGSTGAVEAQLLTVRGYTNIAAKIAGRANLWGARLNGTLDLADAAIGAPGSPADLILTNASLQGDLNASTTLTVSGGLLLGGAHIGGSLDLRGSAAQIQGNLLTVDGDTTLSLVVEQVVNLGGANLKGKLDLTNFGFSESAPDARLPTDKPSASEAFPETDKPRQLLLTDCDIGHALSMPHSAAINEQLKFRNARWTPLACYPGFELLEIQTSADNQSPEKKWRWRGLLRKRVGALIALDGTSPRFHELNRSGALKLQTEDDAKEYLRLFCAYVWGEYGAFALIESREQLPEGSAKDKAAGERVKIKEIEIDTEFQEDFQSLQKTLGLDTAIKISDADEKQQTAILNSILKNHGYRAVAHVRYSDHLFKARFLIVRSSYVSGEDSHGLSPKVEEALGKLLAGNVIMLDDEPVLELQSEKVPTYERPWRYRGTSDFRPSRKWKRLSNELALAVLVPAWRGVITDTPSASSDPSSTLKNAKVNLADASCSTLEDSDGRAWQECLTLNLENFRYTSISSSNLPHRRLRPVGASLRSFFHEHVPGLLTRDLLRPFWFTRPTRAPDSRLQWLKQGIGNTSFLPQPYTHLAKVFREQGDDYAARKIEEKKIELSIKERAKHEAPVRLAKPLWYFYRRCFRYGLSPLRATVTVGVCLLLGYAGVHGANSAGMLTLATAPVSPVLVKRGATEYALRVPVSTPTNPDFDVACPPSMNKFLYATDIFIPLLDIKEQSYCEIRRGSPWTVVLQGLKLLYALLGWVVISLALLTYSGVTRRWSQE